MHTLYMFITTCLGVLNLIRRWVMNIPKNYATNIVRKSEITKYFVRVKIEFMHNGQKE